ncbi:hypothetical protein [Loigolactobacillus bifermentans]|uniref:Uncharacterized protein n=1 Tax=Loigolactobacillus bifermentans DSM 20003 TaxID=1423726 RepID=A0A0R1H020_9LACO|nr:hypothetical protein [Loigolactobacillus bifermentans]KRK39981.1 hypothetical protein FC07_GL001779 [Loigolactobacillus bifermentans DSM 20003]QGG59677.1 hypothetical protein LB003_03810 [Loigolactobacillus bifermentans]
MDEIKLGASSMRVLAEIIAKPLLKSVKGIVQQELKQQQTKVDVLNKRELAKEVFGLSDPGVVDRYMYLPGFPIMPGEGKPRFSRRAVLKWISENQIYHS